MSRKWGRKLSELSVAEKDAIERRWNAREPNRTIGKDFGISSGQVSNLCIKERGNAPHRMHECRKPALVVERGEIAFIFNGTVVRRDGDTMCLTHLWRSAGSPPNYRPAEWFRYRGRDFLAHMQTLGDSQGYEAISGRGGSTWGNKHVALAYATDLSHELRVHVQEVFFSYVEGRLNADSPETEAMLDATQQAFAAAAPKLAENISQMPPATIAEIELLLLRNGVIKRKDLTKETKRLHLGTTAHFFGGMCPCCHEVPVVKDGERLPGSHYDHWTDNAAKCAARDTWLICATCNLGFAAGTLLRDNARVFFDGYQKRLRQFDPQHKLDLNTFTLDS